MDLRLEQLKIWLNECGMHYQSIAPASADASFRRYFRITDNLDSFIVMDAPPDKENCETFVQIANMLAEYGLNTPKILQQDLKQGYLLLSDLGTQVYLSELNHKKADGMYKSAMLSLLNMQNNSRPNLPKYDRTLLKSELDLFPDWYLNKQLQVELNEAQKDVLDLTFEKLINNSLEQPQVCVHRDYHSRNLMVNNNDPSAPGIIDFQDAVIGAVTYDLVSLLKDCYINWSREKVEEWVEYYYNEAKTLQIIEHVDFNTFLRWFDLMGLQRHLKVAGIFSRLKHRDGKTGYLKDIPRTMDYVFEVLELYPEFKPLKKLLSEVM